MEENNKRFDREALMDILPHRGRMLLLDSACLEGEGGAQGSYLVRGDEWFLDGHFPGNPVVPGVVLCEIMAQASCLLLGQALKGKNAYYAGIDKMRFRRLVRPGDQVTVHSRLVRSKLSVYVVQAEARVGEELCAAGECSFILT